MRIRTKRRRGRNDLVVVIFEEDSNFDSDDLSWTPRKEELRKIYKAMKRAGAWD
ncbi:MAG: hypothetical protein ACFFH0_08965 [Promethearchaeota archaeon]